MARLTFKGNPINTNGALPSVGSTAPDFTLVGSDLSDKTLADYAGKKKVLTINPSYDTGVCHATARKFNQSMSDRSDVVVLAISSDLPFAQKRFCEGEGLSNVTPLSAFRSSFAKDYGLLLADGPLRGLTARAVIVLGEKNEVLLSELVPEIASEPDYARALTRFGSPSVYLLAARSVLGRRGRFGGPGRRGILLRIPNPPLPPCHHRAAPTRPMLPWLRIIIPCMERDCRRFETWATACEMQLSLCFTSDILLRRSHSNDSAFSISSLARNHGFASGVWRAHRAGLRHGRAQPRCGGGRKPSEP
jgi:thioredoxin-dependent peroxiredoxin